MNLGEIMQTVGNEWRYVVLFQDMIDFIIEIPTYESENIVNIF